MTTFTSEKQCISGCAAISVLGFGSKCGKGHAVRRTILPPNSITISGNDNQNSPNLMRSKNLQVPWICISIKIEQIRFYEKHVQCCQVFPARSSAFLVASPTFFPHLPSTSRAVLSESTTKIKQHKSKLQQKVSQKLTTKQSLTSLSNSSSMIKHKPNGAKKAVLVSI